MQHKTFAYIAEKYTQGSSNIELFSFCAAATEIYQWGGVPAKTERFHGGFQRALSNRHRRIQKFFDDGQTSPTSIVVAFREGALNTNSLSYPNSWGKTPTPQHFPEFNFISFNLEPFDETTPLPTLCNEVAKLLYPRLSDAGSESNTSDTYEMTEDGNIDEADGTEGEMPESDDATEEIDVGHSKLRNFYDFIQNQNAVNNWLSEENERYEAIKQREPKTTKDKEYLEYTAEQKLKSVLISLLRPATIVDGQHRVWGAYHCDQPNIMFNVCAIKDANWIEQVFQFVVLNKLAKPISTGFLTGLLNTSLTNSEVKEIEVRLENIGIKNVDRKIIKYLNHDDRSPFMGMIAEAGEVAGSDNKGKLSDKGMIKLAKRWKGISQQKLEMLMFKKSLGTTNITKARETWQNYETWIPYFYEFWNRIKRRYDQDDIWVKEVKFHLLYIVTMHVMQDAFLTDQSKANKEFNDVAHFGDEVDKYFKDVPSTFFQSWETTGLQSGDGPRWIREAITSLREGTKLSKLRETSELFRKKEK
jgi:hypothetical protein